MNVHEQAFVERFVASNRRERFLFLLGDPARRQDFLNLFGRLARDLDHRYVYPADKVPDAVAKKIAYLLKKTGKHWLELPGYAISEDGDIDGCRVTIRELEPRGRDVGTIVSFIPGELAYFAPEWPQECCILFRK
jgi:hypothetical protein